MTFTNKIFCDDCGDEVANRYTHECPESEENNAKRKIEHDAWVVKHKRINDAWEAWQDETGHVTSALPSIDHTPDEIAYDGWVSLAQMTEHPDELDSWGSPFQDYLSIPLFRPTWGQVLMHFDEAIKRTGDTHHCYLEGLRHPFDGETKYLSKLRDDEHVMLFSTGS